MPLVLTKLLVVSLLGMTDELDRGRPRARMSEGGARDKLSWALTASLTYAAAADDDDEIVMFPSALFLGDLTELGSRVCAGTSLSLLLSLILIKALILLPFCRPRLGRSVVIDVDCWFVTNADDI